MARMNARFEMGNYHDDFGNVYKIPFKILEGAPQFDKVRNIGFLTDNAYRPRTTPISCSVSSLFTPRHLKVTFYSGRSIQYPVPRNDLIDDFITELMPGLISEFIPGTNEDEAACIDLVGEYWNFVPPATLSMKPDDFRKLPLNGGNAIGPFGLFGGDFEATPGKTKYNYKYNSDVPGVGNIELSFSITNDSDKLHQCQLEGMNNWETSESGGVCSATSLGIEARHLIIKSNVKVDDNFVLPGGKKNWTVIRKAPVSGIDGNFLIPGADKIIPTAKAIADCAQCLGYQGESVKNVHLLV